MEQQIRKPGKVNQSMHNNVEQKMKGIKNHIYLYLFTQAKHMLFGILIRAVF